MKAQEFCYWLQGYFELDQNPARTLTATQLDQIKRHLNMVFIHDIDPKYPPEQAQKLEQAHAGFPDLHKAILRC